jgi:hypothetical protein
MKKLLFVMMAILAFNVTTNASLPSDTSAIGEEQRPEKCEAMASDVTKTKASNVEEVDKDNANGDSISG